MFFFLGGEQEVSHQIPVEVGGTWLSWIYRDRRMNVIVCPTFQFYRGKYIFVGVMQQCGMK